MRDNPVFVCELCGRGFLVMPPGGIDVWPIWGWTEAEKSEGMCAGHVVAADRQTQVRNLDIWEIEHVKDSDD